MSSYKKLKEKYAELEKDYNTLKEKYEKLLSSDNDSEKDGNDVSYSELEIMLAEKIQEVELLENELSSVKEKALDFEAMVENEDKADKYDRLVRHIMAQKENNIYLGSVVHFIENKLG